MEAFLSRFGALVTSVLSGFDRLVFRGHLLSLMRDGGMAIMLSRAGLRLLDFKEYVHATSERVKLVSLRHAVDRGRPVHFLSSATTDKEALARQLLARHPVPEGLICAFKTVEPCMSFEYHQAADPRERGLKLRTRKCMHLYHYYMHPQFGFINARIQTWFPFSIQICINGREWLARQFEHKGRIDFEREDNCFPWFADPEFAQGLMNRQLNIDWKRALDAVAQLLNPIHQQIFKPWPQSYYWSVYQSEWATDVTFIDHQALLSIYPLLVSHAMKHFKSPDVMRFLGRKVSGNFTGEIVSSFKNRPEGVRVKHWVRGNSIKMYDKAASIILRIETTIGNTTDFKVYRPLDDDPNGKLAWRPLRKGIADLHRRAQISQHANETYLDALAAVEDNTPLSQLLDQVAKPLTHDGKRARALRLGDRSDIALLEAVSRGEFAIAGFRNRDIRRLLFADTANKPYRRKLSAKVSRLFRLLRAHGLIRKIPKTHRYNMTSKGRLLAAALFAVRSASIKQLLATAAPAA